MSVTVLIPVYNGAATLRQSLDSILVQDVSDLELLVVDDASQDESGRITDEYATRDARVKVVHNERNLGLAATLNRGLELARHELVARMDQDDESLPGRLLRQVSFMATHPSVSVARSFVYVMGRTRRDDRIVRLPVTSREIARTLPLRNCMYTQCHLQALSRARGRRLSTRVPKCGRLRPVAAALEGPRSREHSSPASPLPAVP